MRAASEAPRIAVLDYGIGNLRSAEKALQHVGADAFLSSDPQSVAGADAMILPGVGAFGPAMAALRDSGLATVALEFIETGRPFLGICVGMQMLYEESDESPGVSGLGVFDGRVIELPDTVKKPQMQWNQLNVIRSSLLFDDLGESPWMYFVHSFAPVVSADTIATCTYGAEITAAAARGNVSACQFHPEKSSDSGLALLRNFVGSVQAVRT